MRSLSQVPDFFHLFSRHARALLVPFEAQISNHVGHVLIVERGAKTGHGEWGGDAMEYDKGGPIKGDVDQRRWIRLQHIWVSC